MAKQSVKNPRKRPDSAGKAAATPVAAPPAVFAPGKPRGKRKSRAKAAQSGKNGVAKHVGKGKLKALLKRVEPHLQGFAAGQPSTSGPVSSAAHPVTRAAPHKVGRRAARPGPMERLEFAIDEVRLGGRTSLRTRKLQLSGIPKMAQKVIEEAGELAIEAVIGNRDALINETVDLIYNLVVLLSGARVPLAAVWAEMERRELTIGMAEKLPKLGDVDG